MVGGGGIGAVRTAGGSVASPGGTGNFQPSVETVKLSFPSDRIHGRSVKSRAALCCGLRIANCGLNVRNPKSEIRNGSTISTALSGTLQYRPLAVFGDGVPNAREWFDEVEPAEPLKRVAQTGNIIRMFRMADEGTPVSFRRSNSHAPNREPFGPRIAGRRDPDHGQFETLAQAKCVEHIGENYL